MTSLVFNFMIVFYHWTGFQLCRPWWSLSAIFLMIAVASSTLLDIREPLVVASSNNLGYWLKFIFKNVYLCEFVQIVVWTLSEHGLVPLTCFTESFCYALGKDCDSCLWFHEFVMRKNLFRNFSSNKFQFFIFDLGWSKYHSHVLLINECGNNCRNIASSSSFDAHSIPTIL